MGTGIVTPVAGYSEGLWTPTIAFATPGDSNIVLNSATVGRYERIGNLVRASFHIQTDTFTHTTASGNLIASGLPFTQATLTALPASGALNFSGVTKAGYTQFTPRPISNTTTFRFTTAGSALPNGDLTAADMPTLGSVILNGYLLYRAA